MSAEYLNAKIGGVPNTKIHIRNIPPHITETHLRSIIGNVGYIKDLCYFNKNKKQMNSFQNGRVYNTALITFNTHEEALNILQNIHNLIDSSGEEKNVEAKFAIPNNAMNNNNNNNSGNMFNRNNYGLTYSNQANNFNENYNVNNNSNGIGTDQNITENSMFNNSNITGNNANNHFLNRSFKNRNNNSNVNNSNNSGGMGNKQMNSLNSNMMTTNNYMFMKYNNHANNKNDGADIGRENGINVNSSMRQHNYQLNNYQSNTGVSANLHNNNANINSGTNFFSTGENAFAENENENSVDGLSLWESYRDSNNNIYYYNNLTKHSQWKKPIHPSKLYQYNSAEKVKQNGPLGSNLFIFHIPSEWSDLDLFEHFCCFGNIISSKIQRDSTGRNSGFGFVSYDNTVSAQQAIQHMNGYFVNNKYLKVQLKKGEIANEA